MSRIGKAPIIIPEKVTVTVLDAEVQVKGPQGQLTLGISDAIKVKVADGLVEVSCESEDRNIRARHGLTRKLIQNMVVGVTDGFAKTLEIVGVGYRAEVKGKSLSLSLGFSHPVEYPIPAGISITVNKQTEIVISGMDRQQVGEMAARIRRLRPPEPYKGKGIKYAGETIIRKAGKSAV